MVISFFIEELPSGKYRVVAVDPSGLTRPAPFHLARRDHAEEYMAMMAGVSRRPGYPIASHWPRPAEHMEP